MSTLATRFRAGLMSPRDKEIMDVARLVSAAEYGFLFDGETDNGPALQRALMDGSPIITPPPGSTKPALVNSPVTMPPGRAITMPSFGDMDNSQPGYGKIVTTAPITTLTTGGSRCVLVNLGLRHEGTGGSILRAPIGSDHLVDNCLFIASAAGNVDPVIYTASSSFSMTNRNRIRNDRTGAWAVEIDRTAAGGINIENRIDLIEITGLGKAFWIHTSVGSFRPEGFHLTNSAILCKGQQLLVNDILSLIIDTCTFDQYQGVDGAILLDPLTIGINNVRIVNCWLAAQGLGGVRGPCIRTGNTNPAAGVKGLRIVANDLGFAQDGVALGPTAVSAVILANYFTALSGFCIRADQSYRTTIEDNIMEDYSGGCLYLRDGNLGGPFIVNANQFGGGAHDIAMTNTNKFLFGDSNTGTALPTLPEVTLASAATVNIGGTNTSRVAITGNAAITSFGTVANRLRFLRFTGAATLTHNATSLILPGGANIVTAVGDTAIAVSEASGNWRLYDYQRGDGSAGLGLTQVDIITTSQTVTVPSWARSLDASAMGGGAGGGSGRCGATGTARTGGGGGGAGALNSETYATSDLGPTLSINIGAGSPGGAAVATDNTNGNAGTDGGTTTILTNGVQILAAPGGQAGGGGGNGVGASGGIGGGGSSIEPIGTGGASSATGGNGGGAANALKGSAGGGAGGGISAANTTSNGGNGARGYFAGGTGYRSGVGTGGVAGTAGSAGPDKAWARGSASGGGGGGSGSGADATTPGGNGGGGGTPGGGGGGGGASTNGTASGAGGAGGRGEVRLIWRA